MGDGSSEGFRVRPDPPDNNHLVCLAEPRVELRVLALPLLLAVPRRPVLGPQRLQPPLQVLNQLINEI